MVRSFGLRSALCGSALAWPSDVSSEISELLSEEAEEEESFQETQPESLL